MRPYRDNLAFQIYEHTFKDIFLPHLFNNVHFLWQTGNTSFHGDNRTTTISMRTVLISLKHLYLFLTWFAMIYSEDQTEFDEKKGYEEKIYDGDSDSLSEWMESTEITISTVNIANYRKKVESYIWQLGDHITIHKHKFNKEISSVDSRELEEMIFKGDLGSKEDFIKIYGSVFS